MSEFPQAMDLLASAAEVAGRSVAAAALVDPGSRTPCTEWDLATLVRHVADSAAVLRQLLDGTAPEPLPAPGCEAARHELERLREAIDRAARNGRHLELAALVGSYELAVHAWDINRAAHTERPLPTELVGTLLELAPVVLADVERAGLFAAPLPPGGERTDVDRLLALFGRRDTRPDLARAGRPWPEEGSTL